jgi:23S rRNA (cytosine1962-C5)-methyltransferase
MIQVRLKPKREKPLLQRHPWIFSGAVDSVEGVPEPGETVDVCSSAGEWLARGAYSPHSQIRIRIWTWEESEAIDESFIATRIQRALLSRERLAGDPEVTAYREVFAESDGVPGLIVDRYGDLRVVQLLTAGAERWRRQILDVLAREGECRGLYERSDSDARALEGLAESVGPVWGEPPQGPVEIKENGLRFLVDPVAGQKTGFYLDQRENRSRVRAIVGGGELLDCFSYTGGFTVAGLKGGVERALALESSAAALEMAHSNLALNGLAADRLEGIVGDAFVELRRLRDRGRQFDVIVVDPPRFAPTSSQVQRAARGYKDINLLAFKLLRPGGLLFTFSCSGGVGPDLFQKIVADAALDAGVQANVIEWLGQPADHPVALSFPEGRYLKGLVIRIGG